MTTHNQHKKFSVNEALKLKKMGEELTFMRMDKTKTLLDVYHNMLIEHVNYVVVTGDGIDIGFCSLKDL